MNNTDNQKEIDKLNQSNHAPIINLGENIEQAIKNKPETKNLFHRLIGKKETNEKELTNEDKTISGKEFIKYDTKISNKIEFNFEKENEKQREKIKQMELLIEKEKEIEREKEKEIEREKEKEIEIERELLQKSNDLIQKDILPKDPLPKEKDKLVEGKF